LQYGACRSKWAKRIVANWTEETQVRSNGEFDGMMRPKRSGVTGLGEWAGVSVFGCVRESKKDVGFANHYSLVGACMREIIA
jgi:hypothetical protein